MNLILLISFDGIFLNKIDYLGEYEDSGDSLPLMKILSPYHLNEKWDENGDGDGHPITLTSLVHIGK